MRIHDNEDYLVINMKTWYNNYFTQNGLIFQHNCPQVNEFKQLVREHVVSIINEFLSQSNGKLLPHPFSQKRKTALEDFISLTMRNCQWWATVLSIY